MFLAEELAISAFCVEKADFVVAVVVVVIWFVYLFRRDAQSSYKF